MCSRMMEPSQETKDRLLQLHGWRQGVFGFWHHPRYFGIWIDPWPELVATVPEIRSAYIPALEEEQKNAAKRAER